MRPEVRIGELRLVVPGLNADEGARLGRIVAERLAGGVVAWSTRPIGSLAVSMESQAGASVEALGAAIADRIARGLR